MNGEYELNIMIKEMGITEKKKKIVLIAAIVLQFLSLFFKIQRKRHPYSHEELSLIAVFFVIKARTDIQTVPLASFAKKLCGKWVLNTFVL
jgi:hypothetical protein